MQKAGKRASQRIAKRTETYLPYKFIVSVMFRINRKQNERVAEHHCKIDDPSKIHFPILYD